MTEERRIVTVLFADVAGSTALGEQIDPEDMRTLLARFYSIAREVIAAHGGTLEKFIGDAVMAVFGLPQAHGDDAERAVSAALEIRDQVREDSSLSPHFAIRTGVNTGEVVAARDRSAGDFLVTGDAVNVAARLQQGADPWMVLCGERTIHAAARGFVFGTVAEVSAKGKPGGVRAAPVISPRPTAVPARIPLIGRDADLAQLELVARRAFGERRPFLVSLVAPAGTGKTRLLEEFLDTLSDLAPRVTVAIAQCLPYGQRLTYWPLRAVLFRLVGLPEDAPPETVRAGVHAWVQAQGIPSPQRVGDLLAATIGVGEAEVVDQAALFAAWRTIVETAARQTPLVLVFEDLHWSSDSLLDLVEFVMQPRGDAPVVMIALARPELLDRRPAWGGGRRNSISLALEPLSDDAVARLVTHLLGGSVPQIADRVVARAEGNPFYAGEIVRSLMDRVPTLEDSTAIERALTVLPDTVQATVLARLDLLPPNERRVVQLGAVFGRAFSIPGVAAIAPDLTAGIEGLTDLLVAKDLIRPSDTDRFTFRHILIREVAYQTLPRSERAHLHAAAGRWLEEQAGGREEALAELIAYHYREAATLLGMLRAGDAARADIRQKAVRWLVRAADLASAGAAFLEAQNHLRSAIELADPDALPELYEYLGNVTVGDAGAEAFREALRQAREAGRSPDQQLRVIGSLLILLTRWQGTLGTRPSEEEMSRLRADGRSLLEQATDERAVATFLIGEAFFPFWRSASGAHSTSAELDQAEASVRRGLEIATRLDDARLRSTALDGVGSLAQERGAWEDSRRAAQQRLEFQDRLDLVERTDAYAMVANSAVLEGDLGQADEATAAGLAVLLPGQVIVGALHLVVWRSYAAMLRGTWDEAILIGDRARQLWLESGLASTAFAVHGFIAALDVARARQDERRVELYREVLEAILRSIRPGHRAQRLRPYLSSDLEKLEAQLIRRFDFTYTPSPIIALERALALCADWQYALSPEIIRPFIEFAAACGCRILEGQARRVLGLALRNPDELGRALTLFERSRAVPYAARVRCERALLAGDNDELAVGLKILEGLGDLDQIGRIEQALRK